MLGMGHGFQAMLASSSTGDLRDGQGVMALDGVLILLQHSIIGEQVPDEAVLVEVHH